MLGFPSFLCLGIRGQSYFNFLASTVRPESLSWPVPPHTQSPGRIPKKRTPISGLQYSYGVDYRALRWNYFLDRDLNLCLYLSILKSIASLKWIYFLDPPRALG